MSYERKIIQGAELAARLDPQRRGRSVVQCHGCFDIVHPGHVRYLQFARRLGDVLIVSLTGDAGVGKGPDRPYIPEALRAENLAALEFVDWVVIDPNPTACELLATLKPDVYVKGREYAASADARFLRERAIVEGYGGRVVFHSGDVVFSSTRLIQSLDAEPHLTECRARAMCQSNGIDLPAARAAVQQLRGVRTLVVGDVVRERYVLCDACGDPGPVALSLQQLGQRWFWGGAAALAIQLRALGADVTLITAVARTPRKSQDDLRHEMARRGVTAVLLPVGGGFVTHSTFIADDAKLLQLTQGAAGPLDSASERLVADAIDARLPDTRLLVWSEHGCGTITPGLVRRATPHARAAGARITGAAGGRGDLAMLRDTDLITVAEKSLRHAAHDLAAGLPAIAWRWLSQTRGRTMIVSLHKSGLLSFDGRGEDPLRHAEQPQRLRSGFVPATTTHYVDTLGVDEAVLATASLAIAAEGSLAMAAYLAGGATALVAARGGRTFCSADDLAAWIESRPELRPESRFLPDAATPGDIARLAPPLALASAD